MPELREAQLGLVSYLRDPSPERAPGGIEPRRLQIYRDLVYNNIEGFLRNGFPVLYSLYSPDRWQALVRQFIRSHRCRSPYFLEIGQEFLAFLMEEYTPEPEDPPFMLELAHYEWVELALDVATEVLPEKVAPEGELLDHSLQLSPLAWVLSYRFPVHLIGPEHQPTEPGGPVYLLVWRDRNLQVAFMALNAPTARLLELSRDSAPVPGRALLEQLADELGQSADTLREAGRRQLFDFIARDILLIGS